MIVRLLQTYLSLLVCANLAIGRRPTCLFQKSEMGWQSCDEFVHQDQSDLCCAIGTYPFRKLNSRTTLNGFAEIMFNFSSHLENVKHMFVLDRSERCLMTPECYLLDADSSFSFKQNVQFRLTGDQPFRVLYFSETEYNHWILNTTSKECKFFQASAITIDQDGESRSDLILRITPPVDNSVMPANISSACVHIYSAKTSSNFTCAEGVKSSGEIKRSFCHYNPYGNHSVLRVNNATHYVNETHEFKFHCAQATMGAYCHLLSEMLIVTPPRVTKPPNSYYLPSFLTSPLWILTSIVCAFFVFSGLVYLLRHSRKQLQPCPVSSEQPLLDELPFRGVLLYCKEGEHLENIVLDLIALNKRDSHVLLVNPYDDRSAVIEAPVEHAKSLLLPGRHILSFQTDRTQTVRGRRNNNDVYDQFYIAASRFIERHPHLFTVLNLTFKPDVYDVDAEKVYLLTDRNKIQTLLTDILGGDRMHEIENQVNLLQRHIDEYTQRGVNF